MKATEKRIMWLLFILLGAIFLIVTGLTVTFLCNTNQQEVIISGQFALVGGRPVIIKEGNIFEYEKDETWRQLELAGKAKQVVRGEVLCVLYKDGGLYYGENLDLSSEVFPLTSAYNLYMANLALKLNDKEPFININQSIEYLGFRALLQNGDILYQGAGRYERYQMEKETPIFLSGSYILTAQGNVYCLNVNLEDDSSIVSTDLKCVYDGGDIVAISASETAARCLGLRRNGKVISWSDIGSLDVTGWRNVVAISQGFNYAVGLDNQGRMFYVDYNSISTEAVSKALKQWIDVAQIAVYSDTITGLKQDDSCVFLNISDYQ